MNSSAVESSLVADADGDEKFRLNSTMARCQVLPKYQVSLYSTLLFGQELNSLRLTAQIPGP